MKTKNINIKRKRGFFTSIFIKKEDRFEISDLKRILSDSKAKIIETIREKEPDSIYELSKLLERDFKLVRDDIKVLNKFGIIELIVSRKGRRESLKPVIKFDELNVRIEL